MRFAVRLVLLFLVPFLVAGAAIRLAAPPNPDYVWHPTYSAKLDWLRETDEHYDIVFVGNSRTYLGVDPFIVQETMAADGCDVSTYNLGSVAQSKFEFDHMVESLADIPGGTPDYVVSLDRSLFEIGLVRDFSTRQRVHMDFAAFPDALSYIRNLPDDTGMKSVAKAIDLTLGFAVNQVPVGAIHQELFEQSSLEDEVALVEEWRGYTPWDVIESTRGTEEIEGLRATVTAAVESGEWEWRWTDKEPTPERVDRWVETIAAHVEQAPDGAKAVHVLIPSDFDALTAQRIAEAWEASGNPQPLINLVDERQVGDYTDPGFWSDTFHVNELGAERISVALGRQLCTMMHADGTAPTAGEE